MSDIEPSIPVVDISNSRSRYRDDESGEDYDSEYDSFNSEEDERTASPASPARSTNSHGMRKVKTVNGKKVNIDMTPPDEQLKLAIKRAKKFAAKKKVDKAIHEYTRCIALSRIVYGSNHWKYAESQVNLAEAYLELKDYKAQAEYHSENAKNVMLHGVHTTSTQQEKADVYYVLTRIYRTLGQAYTAEQCLTKASRIGEEREQLSCVNADEVDDTNISLSLAMARLHSKQKKHALSSAEFDKALELMKDRYGEDALELIPSKGRHANHEKAIDQFLQAHSIAGCHYKDGSMELVDTALSLAQAYANTGRDEAEDSAKSYLEECLVNCTTVYGPHHAKTLEVQDELARLLIRTDRHDEAMNILKSSINPKCEVFGDYSESVSDTYKLMASVHLSQGNIEKALRAYKKCHNIETLVLGKNHKKTKESQTTMELLMASPGISSKFVLDKSDELQKRPKFNSVVNRSRPI
ncbi:hypothetical protein LOTGIDRAFT_233473 [Lottia gigantea]|uniref:MalT-like TPR region domain-containing protein n=1 Tax=Lottia gigantea TaxID=225164 RepID=V4BQ25_LOTGI|nr:hypothetical protein LOTGIDRAFT_233473 [Lottia gigantea]ESO90959.1 hypothetical protein LOTGIDRAFT_233473 [Lottia gigantea]